MEANPSEARYIREKREDLIRDRGISEEDLSGGVRLMIDRTISRLIVSRRIELYLQRNGILRRDSLKRRKILEPEPVLIFWLQLQNSIDRALVALGLDRRKAEEVLDLQRYAAEKYGPARAGQGGDVSKAGEGEKSPLARPGRESQGKDKASRTRVEDEGQAQDEDAGAGPAREGVVEGGGDE